MLFDELKTVLISIGLPEEELTPETGREEAGLDSLAIAELALVLRRDGGLAVEEDEIHAAATLGEVAAAVRGGKVAAP
ncbi:acyl carrier protein [Kitasatospora sp. NBC_00315]|uniref:acyl carrier protein n=1 Tax=Kitasatospora sp. NBC_00315 TaxID=2975963 RepID=UPI00324ABCD9